MIGLVERLWAGSATSTPIAPRITDLSLAVASAGGGSVVRDGGMGLASVVVAPAAIEIEYGGATIRVSAGSDAATLRAVLQALKAVA